MNLMPLIGPISPIVRREILRQALLNRCLRVCAIAVRGSAGTITRFRQDLTRAQEIFGCANVTVQEGGYMQVVDSSLLDLTEWTTTNVPDDAKRLLAMGPSCGRSERLIPIVYAYYVRTLGGGYNGIGRPNFANDAPGLVISDVGNSNTFAHEIGHILGLDHDPDTGNIMYFDSPNITSDPPRITAAQCNTAFASRVPIACPNVLDIPVVRVPPVIPRLPVDLGPELVGLLSDDPDVVERFAARGQTILPALLRRTGDPNPAVRTRVLAVLARIGGPMALEALEMAAQTDASPSVRATAASALAEANAPTAATVLTRALQDRDPGVRAAVLRSLARIRAPGTLMAIGMTAVREVDPAVRLLAGRLAMGMQ